MIHSEPARATTRRVRIRRTRVAGALVVAAIVAALGFQLPGSPSSPTSVSSTASRSSPRTAAAPVRALRAEEEPSRALGEARGEHRDALGEAGGAVPGGTTVFDDAVPGVANLDADLLGALRRAATDASDGGVKLVVDSGWRSPAYQERLLQEAVAKYGSREEAARWVATPETSAHVSGDAIDVGPSSAAAWLSEHGAEYGLCRVYGNEPWHFELRPEAGDRGCPALYADPTHDPRMQR